MSKSLYVDLKAVVRRETSFGDVDVDVHVPSLRKHVFSNLCKISLINSQVGTGPSVL